MRSRKVPGRIALAVRVRDEWDLVIGLLESLGETVSEAWILDDAGLSDPPLAELVAVHPCCRVFRASEWSGAGGDFGEGAQRDWLLQIMKRESACDWVLQLDADERIAAPMGLGDLTTVIERDAWILPLVDFYITPEDAHLAGGRHPESVRSWYGPEVRWTLSLFRLVPALYCSRGDVREPQGFARSRTAKAKLVIEHYGKAVSIEEWDRKARFYVAHYPEYREKWQSRIGAAVHSYVSDFDAPLLRRGTGVLIPDGAPTLWSYVHESGLRTVAKRVVYGWFGRKVNCTPVREMRP